MVAQKDPNKAKKDQLDKLQDPKDPKITTVHPGLKDLRVKLQDLKGLIIKLQGHKDPQRGLQEVKTVEIKEVKKRGQAGQRRAQSQAARPQRPAQRPKRPQAQSAAARPQQKSKRPQGPKQQSSSVNRKSGGGTCPGGALEMCIDVCPSFSARIFGACVAGCAKRCPTKK